MVAVELDIRAKQLITPNIYLVQTNIKISSVKQDESTKRTLIQVLSVEFHVIIFSLDRINLTVFSDS